MSQSDTGATTIRALRRRGSRVATTGWLRDVDTAADAEAVAAAAPDTRFAARWVAERRRRVAQDRDLAAVDSETLRHSSETLRHSPVRPGMPS